MSQTRKTRSGWTFDVSSVDLRTILVNLKDEIIIEMKKENPQLTSRIDRICDSFEKFEKQNVLWNLRICSHVHFVVQKVKKCI